MDYLRRSVSLRAYGQRDPLLEYRKEGLLRFRQLEEAIKTTAAEVLPRLAKANDARVRVEEEKTRAALVAAGKEDGSGAPIKKAPGYGRNEMVTLRKGSETQTLKFKKAERLLTEGWEIVVGS